MTIHIEMRYKLRSSDQIHVRVIPPEEYFDPLGPGETYAREGDPKFRQNHEYLDVDVAELEWTECVRRGAMNNTTLRTQFLKDGSLTHNASTPDATELIHLHSWLPDGTEHFIRIRRLSQTSPWKVESNCLYRKAADGTPEGFNLEEAGPGVWDIA